MKIRMAIQAKSYQIPTIRLFSQYGTATGGIEHAAGLVTPLGTNPRGGDLRFGSRGRAGGGGGGKVRIWAFAEFGANGQFLTEIASRTTASCTLAYLSPLISVKFCFGKVPLVYLGWYHPPFRLRTDHSRRIPQVTFWPISPPAQPRRPIRHPLAPVVGHRRF